MGWLFKMYVSHIFLNSHDLVLILFCFSRPFLSHRIHVWISMISLPTFTILLVNIPYMDPIGYGFSSYFFTDGHICKFPTYQDMPGRALVWRDSFPTASRSTNKNLGGKGKSHERIELEIGKHNQGFHMDVSKIVGEIPPKSSIKR